MRRLLFFDIDGTLWNWKNEIPDSTREAVRQARKQGCLAFINSGRTRGFIQNEDLLSIGFDGIVSGCGTMIEYQGEIIYDAEMPQELAIEIVSGVRRYGWKPVLEGKEYLYMDEDEFADDWYGQKLKKELGARLLPISSEWGNWKIQKLSCNIQDAEREACIEEFEDRFDFILHDLAVCELVPRPHSKGTAIDKLCDLLGVPVSDTFAFGDSVNDREMLLKAGTSIVMGSGSDRAKEMADYITTNQEDDGIWNACCHFGLV